MRSLYFLILFNSILLICSSTALYGQVSSSVETKLKANEEAKRLNEGALLVRLFTRETTAAQLRERGLTSQADELLARQKEENQVYIDAFAQEYDFSNVYFFGSEDSPKVKSGDLEGVTFFDKNGESDASIKVEADHYYIAEFSTVEGGDAQGVQSYRMEKEESGMVQKPNYYGNPDLGFSALVIKNSQFEQLDKPFPYYVRFSNGFSFFGKKPKGAVKKMNQLLYNTL